MHRTRLRQAFAAVLVSLTLGQAAFAQTQPPIAASGQTQLSQLPLRRDAAVGGSIAESAGWAALFVAGLASVAFVMIRRRTLPGSGPGGSWLRPVAGASMPKALWRMSLTQQASLHLVEWRGEELLLGCTPQSVTILARRALGASREPDGGVQGKP